MQNAQNIHVSRVLNWMQDHLPNVMADLQTGARPSELYGLETVWNVDFDLAFKALYTTANGQKNKTNTGFFYGLEFLSIDRMTNFWLNQVNLIRENSRNKIHMNEFAKSFEEDKIKEVYASEKWVPFAYDWGGNFLGLDFDPGQNGKMGQIINFGRDEDVKFVVADDFGSFIKWYADQLEEGNFFINTEDDGGKSLNTKIPPSGHFLDSIRKMYELEGQMKGR